MTTNPSRAPDLASIEADPARLWIGFGLLREVEVRRTREGKPWALLRVADSTRRVTARVWSEAAEALEAAGRLRPGTPVKLLFCAESYQGELQLNVKKLRQASEQDEGYDESVVVGSGFAAVRDLASRTLVFDIETVPAFDRRELPTTVAETVARSAEKHNRDEGMVMALSPFLGKVVSVAVGDGEVAPDEQSVTVLAVPPPGDPAGREYPDWIRPMTERELLSAFWSLAFVADTVVSFNGRGFDVPFLIGRSLIHDVPVHADLVSNRYSLRPHLDLLQVLTGSGYPRGPTSLDVVCLALGIESPKVEMDGSMVAPAYARGEIEKVAAYNAHDVQATTAVYQRVCRTLLRYREDW